MSAAQKVSNFVLLPELILEKSYYLAGRSSTLGQKLLGSMVLRNHKVGKFLKVPFKDLRRRPALASLVPFPRNIPKRRQLRAL